MLWDTMGTIPQDEELTHNPGDKPAIMASYKEAKGKCKRPRGNRGRFWREWFEGVCSAN